MGTRLLFGLNILLGHDGNLVRMLGMDLRTKNRCQEIHHGRLQQLPNDHRRQS